LLNKAPERVSKALKVPQGQDPGEILVPERARQALLRAEDHLLQNQREEPTRERQVKLPQILELVAKQLLLLRKRRTMVKLLRSKILLRLELEDKVLEVNQEASLQRRRRFKEPRRR